MKYCEEQYTLPLCKLAIDNKSKYRDKWLNEIVDYIITINNDEQLAKNAIEYKTFYDLDDSWNRQIVLTEILNHVKSKVITDIPEFSVSLELTSILSKFVYNLKKYCVNLWKQNNKYLNKSQIKSDIATFLVI